MKRHKEVLIAAICLLLAIAAFASRLYRLDEIPPGLHFDEGAHGVDALQILQGNHAPFLPDNSGREALIVYGVALAHALLGRSIWAIRLPTALASAGAVLSLFYAGYILFGTNEETNTPRPWRGIFIGGLSAALLTISLNHLVLGRIAFRANYLILLLPLCLALLWRGWRHRSWLTVTFAALLAGILQYTYIPARLLPVLLLLFSLTFLIPLNDNAMRRLREGWPQATLFATASALVAAPLFVYFALHPEHMFDRISQVTLFSHAKTSGDPLSSLLLNVWDHLLVFGFRGDPNWIHNYDALPMLSPWETPFFWLGLALCLWRWRTHAICRLLLIWFGIMLLPALLARNPYPYVPNSLRMMGAMPAVYLLTAFAVWETLQLLKKQTHVVIPTFVPLIAILIVAQGAFSYRTYFDGYELWARGQKDFYGQWTDAAVELSSVPAIDYLGGGVYLILSENAFAHYGFDYLYEGNTPVYIVNHRGPGMPYEVGTSRQTLFLLSRGEPSTIVMLDWNEELDWNNEEEREMFALLRRYAHYAGSQQFSTFQLHTFENLSLRLPWRFYEELEPRTVTYDADISLLGLAVGQGAEQINSQDVISLDRRGQSIWVGMRWKIDHSDFDSNVPSSMDVDYNISLRLYDVAGAQLYHKDRPLKNPDADTTTDWMPGQPVDTLFFLDIPSDLPSGSYELRLLIYNVETLIPTVEIGTWQPETVLAKVLVQ